MTLLLFLSIGSGFSVAGQAVRAQSGDIYYTDATGSVRQLTSGGTDSDPALSFDGKKIVFIRRTSIPADVEEPTDPHPVRTEIWIADLVSGERPQRVFRGPVVVDHSSYATFSEPRLTPDNRHVYFLINYAVVEFGLVRLDLESGQARMISGALGWYIVGSGKYAGDLVVQKRKTYAGGNSEVLLVDLLRWTGTGLCRSIPKRGPTVSQRSESESSISAVTGMDETVP